jgi:hypothetical protein
MGFENHGKFSTPAMSLDGPDFLSYLLDIDSLL